jgi:hypothetical protein
MRFRAGFIVGAAIGYYYGAKAGRERYEQLDRALERVRRHPSYQQASEVVTGRLGQVQDLAKDKIGSIAGGSLDSVLGAEPEYEPGLEFNPDYRPTEQEMLDDFGESSSTPFPG